MGLEPTTFSLATRRSTTELCPLILKALQLASFIFASNNKFWNERYSDKIINVNYESLVENFEEEVKKLFVKLNLNWEKQLYDFHKNERPVETASFLQVRTKVYQKSSEQWKNYEKYLTSMIDILSANNVEF